MGGGLRSEDPSGRSHLGKPLGGRNVGAAPPLRAAFPSVNGSFSCLSSLLQGVGFKERVEGGKEPAEPGYGPGPLAMCQPQVLSVVTHSPSRPVYPSTKWAPLWGFLRTWC